MEFKKIVCGVTGSPGSEKAALAAAELARDNHAELVYLYAVDLAFLGGLTVELRPEYAEKSRAHLGQHILDDAEQAALALGVKPVKALRMGKVLEVIQAALKEEGADLLVIDDEGRTFVEKHLLGGRVVDFAEDLQAQTGVKVMVVR